MRMAMMAVLLSGMFSMTVDVLAAACGNPQRVSSGASTMSIAELYTSEGCDSCPPADKWFSSLNVKKDGVVPLAFHVIIGTTSAGKIASPALHFRSGSANRCGARADVPRTRRRSWLLARICDTGATSHALVRV